MAAPSFFEGPEKKLEAVVTPDFPPLRSLGDDMWRSVVEAAGAKILSVLRSEHCDAYLLSESSLFVYDDWFAMMTCGQTTLVAAFEEEFDIDMDEEEALMVKTVDAAVEFAENSPYPEPEALLEDVYA